MLIMPISRLSFFRMISKDMSTRVSVSSTFRNRRYDGHARGCDCSGSVEMLWIEVVGSTDALDLAKTAKVGEDFSSIDTGEVGDEDGLSPGKAPTLEICLFPCETIQKAWF